jgi:hypothetical protein
MSPHGATVVTAVDRDKLRKLRSMLLDSDHRFFVIPTEEVSIKGG